MRKQSGFTLIELAIVLVIIGLLLGGVLKGQELINSAKAKSMAADLKNIQVFIYGYQDKFKAIPGDDANVNNHIQGLNPASTPGTVGNGIIEGNWNSQTVTDESFLFWQQVRSSGLATGPTSIANVAAYIPRNADNGQIGVQSISGFAMISGMTGLYVACSDQVSGRIAKQIDTNLDDGETSTGSVRVVPAGTAANAAASATTSANVVDANAYIVCMSF